MKQLILLFCLSVAGIFSLNAQCTWTGAVNTNWSEAGNWSCGHVPGAADDVVINTFFGIVTLDVADITISSLDISNSSTLTGNYDVLVTGDLICGGAIFSGAGTITVEGVTTITSFDVTLDTRNLILNGGGSFNNQSLILSNNATLTISEDQMLSILSNFEGISGENGMIINHGIIEKNETGYCYFTSPLTNTGVININEGVLEIAANANIIMNHVGAVINIASGCSFTSGTHATQNFTNSAINGEGAFLIHETFGNPTVVNLLSGNTIGVKVVVCTATLNL